MRRFFSLSVMVVLASVTLSACNSMKKGGVLSGNGGVNGSATTTPSPNTGDDGVRRITVVELRDALDKGQAIVVDTRGADSYKASHIKGSISIPLEHVATRSDELPHDKLIVTYCS